MNNTSPPCNVFDEINTKLETVSTDGTNRSYDKLLDALSDVSSSDCEEIDGVTERNNPKSNRVLSLEERVHFEEIFSHLPLLPKRNKSLRSLSSVSKRYYTKRYKLFRRYDQGILLDAESWFSVTPEWIAEQQVQLLGECGSVVDGFCGCGGNTKQFGLAFQNVHAIDIDGEKIRMAKKNLRIYGVPSGRVQFVVADFYEVLKTYRSEEAFSHLSYRMPFPCDLLFLSPPWGGPSYNKYDQLPLEEFFDPTVLDDCLSAVSEPEARPPPCQRLMLYLPRNCLFGAVFKRLRHHGFESIQLIQHWEGDSLKAISLYAERENVCSA